MLGFKGLTNFKVFQILSNTPNIFNYAPIRLDWLQSLKQFFINVSYYIRVASLHLMALFKQFFINVPYHIPLASLTLMAL